METYKDNIENKINELIDKLIYGLNERRERLLSILRIKRVELRAVQAIDEQVEQQLVEARATLISQKIHNKLQSMHRRMLNEVDMKINDYVRPRKELRFEGNTCDLDTQIDTLGVITLHELPILPSRPQRAATPGVSSKPDIDSPTSVQQHQSENHLPKPKPHHVTEDPKQYLWGRMSREDCETLLLQRAKQGEFIFRESPNRQGELVLSMRYRHVIYHFNIIKEDNWFCLSDKYRMKSIDDIISFFQKTRIATYKDVDDILIDVFLSRPLNMTEMGIKV